MADFKISLAKVLKAEGGYTADPDDNGNWTGGIKGGGALVGTNYGITARDLMGVLGRVPTVSDMRNIPMATVELVYRKSYWNPIKGDTIENQLQADDIMDSAVNQGVGTAIIMVKRTLGLPENTTMDDNTVSLLNNKQC